MKILLRSLRHSDYRLYLCSQTLSLVGTWVQQVAQAWLMYKLTSSATMLGVLAIAQQGPGFFGGPIAGVFVDRYDKRRILTVTQSLAGCAAGFLATVTFMGIVEPWHILLAALGLGCVHAIDIPARQSAFIEMVGRDDLPNAIGLNSSIVNGARLIGPAIAGALIVSAGEAWCFAVNALSYIPIAISFRFMKFQWKAPIQPREPSVLKEMSEGFEFVRQHRTMSALFALHAVCALVGMPYLVLLPAHSTTVLSGGPGTLSVLMAAAGGGAFLGALFVASRRSMAGLSRYAVGGGAIFGLGLLAFSTARGVLGASVLLFVAGTGCMIQAASTNTLLQTLSPDGMRGRIVSLYSSLYMGMVPLGGFIAGVMSDRWTTSPVLAFAGVGVAAGTLLVGRGLVANEVLIA